MRTKTFFKRWKRRTELFCFATGALFLIGCSPNIKGIKPPESFEKEARELVKTQESRNAVAKQLAEAKKQLPEKQASIPPLEAEVKDLRAKLEVLEKADETAYMKVTQLASGKDMEAALKATKAFIRDYPTSRLVGDAGRLAESLATSLGQQIEQKQQLDEKEKIRQAAIQKDLQERFTRRELTLTELKTFLKGKNQDEIVALLGTPGQGNNVNWIYEGDYVTDDAGRRRGIVIYFDGGRVSSVGFR